MAQLRRLKITVNSDHYPTEPERVAYAVSHLRGDTLVQVAAYIEKTDLHQPPTLDFIVEIFRTQPTVPRPRGSKSTVLQPAIHSSPSFILLRNLLLQSPQSILHSPRSILHSPRSTTLHGPAACSPQSAILHTRSTILHSPRSFQSTTLYGPRPFTVRHPPSPRLHHPPHPTVLLPFLTEGLLRQAGASRAAPQYYVAKKVIPVKKVISKVIRVLLCNISGHVVISWVHIHTLGPNSKNATSLFQRNLHSWMDWSCIRERQ